MSVVIEERDPVAGLAWTVLRGERTDVMRALGRTHAEAIHAQRVAEDGGWSANVRRARGVAAARFAAVVAATYVSDIWLDIDYGAAADISLACIAAWSTMFAIRYAGWSRWWTNRIGKVYLAKSIILALVLIQAAVSVWWSEDHPGRGPVRFAIYALGSAALVSMLVTLWQEQRRDRRKRAAATRSDTT